MNTLKNILTVTFLIVMVQFGYGQSMKPPVSYRLKNGLTVIVAENSATQKVFSTLSFESQLQHIPANATVQELVNTILTQQLPNINEGLSFTDKGINLATTTDQFEDGLAAMYTYVSAPDFTEDVLKKAKMEVIAHIAANDKYYPEAITIAAVNKIGLNELNTYYLQMANPATAYLTVAGNINAGTVRGYGERV